MSDEPMPRCDFDGKRLILKLNMDIAADVNAISPLVDSVMGIVAEVGCAAGKELEVETSLREALANAIVHGCEKDPRKTVQFCVACDETRGMLIVVRDPGAGFDPAKIPSPVIGETVFSSHGRGIYLINELMDEVRIERGGTEIHMRKK
jgi:serine/threonine-protein kinase RsbW